jgi:transcriptional regulator with XRE-family HTH domain
MIKNKGELQSTQDRLNEFKHSLKLLSVNPNSYHPVQFQMKKDALISYIEEFEADIQDYNQLISGQTCLINISSLADLGLLLIKARLAFKLSQSDLAKQVGTTQQQIQRWESSNYESISWSKMLIIIAALKISIPVNAITLKKESISSLGEFSTETILDAIEKVKNRQSLFVIANN